MGRPINNEDLKNMNDIVKNSKKMVLGSIMIFVTSIFLYYKYFS